jgi:hypothetical protein
VPSRFAALQGSSVIGMNDGADVLTGERGGIRSWSRPLTTEMSVQESRVLQSVEQDSLEEQVSTRGAFRSATPISETKLAPTCRGMADKTSTSLTSVSDLHRSTRRGETRPRRGDAAGCA